MLAVLLAIPPLLYVSDIGSPGEMHLVVVGRDGKPQRLTKSEYVETGGVRSPDGKLIAASIIEARFTESICVLNADGSGRRTLVPPEEKRTLFGMAWSPDGKTIAYSNMPSAGSKPGPSTLWRIGLDGSGRKRLGGGMLPAWSRDGKRILFTDVSTASEAKGTMPSLWTMNVDGSGRKLLVPNAIMGAWSPKGDRIVYVGVSKAGVMNLFLRRADGSGARQITRLNDPFISGPEWLDEKTIVFTRAATGKSEPAMGLYTVSTDGGTPRPVSKGGTMNFVGNGASFFLVIGALSAVTR